jgi:hypothetical protein
MISKIEILSSSRFKIWDKRAAAFVATAVENDWWGWWDAWWRKLWSKILNFFFPDPNTTPHPLNDTLSLFL